MSAKARLRYAWSFLRFLWQELQVRQWRQSAAALTYTSLFALVPILAVSYALLTVLPPLVSVQGHIAAFIFTHFLPDTGYQIWDYLQEFSQQARQLTVPGLLMLIITALMMLKTIENAFNDIWEVKQGRKGIASFLLYWAVLSLGPVLIGAALMLSTYLLSLNIFSDVQQLSLVQRILAILPLLLSTAALCLMYSAVPNCPVPLKHALSGAFITALVFGLVKDLFALGVKYSSYKLVYGAFAAVPLFLTWVYLCWMILLFGAVLVRSFGTYSERRENNPDDVMIALSLLQACWEKQQRGEALALSRWQRQREVLLAHRYLQANSDGQLLLARDLHSVTLWDVRQLFLPDSLCAPASAVTAEAPWQRQALQLMAEDHQRSRKHLSISLAELFESSRTT